MDAEAETEFEFPRIESPGVIDEPIAGTQTTPEHGHDHEGHGPRRLGDDAAHGTTALRALRAAHRSRAERRLDGEKYVELLVLRCLL